jgi:hypothetical protein
MRAYTKVGTTVVIKSTLSRNQEDLPHYAALEAATISIPTRTDTLTVSAWPDFIILTQCSRHSVFAAGYDAKHQMRLLRLTNTRGRTLCDLSVQSSYEIIGPHTATQFPLNYNHPRVILDIPIRSTTGVPLLDESVEELRSDHSPVFLFMDLEE